MTCCDFTFLRNQFGFCVENYFALADKGGRRDNTWVDYYNNPS